MTPTTKKRVSVAIAALIGSAIAFGGASAPAMAEPLVNPTGSGSITVHKLQSPDSATGLPANGMPVDTTGLLPLSGVTFEVSKVEGIDLSKNSGWTAAEALSDTFNADAAAASVTAAGYTLGAATEATTSGDGTALFGGLPIGLYLVSETVYPSGVTPSAPFLVTVPITDPVNSNTWVYDVHVYPKNSVTTATKTVDDSGDIKIGDAIEWTITGDIPNEDIIDGYKVVDVLDAKLDHVSTIVELEDGTPLVASDYTATYDAATHTVEVVFTEEGRALLAEHNTTRVKVTVETTVNAIGEIANEAAIYPNAASFLATPGEPGGPTVTPPTVSKWGEITFEKVNPAGDALAGATFRVYASKGDAESGVNPLTLGGDTDFQVDANGLLTISGLRYSGWANGAAIPASDSGYITYYLVETVAPENYSLLAEPLAFTIDADTTAAGIDVEIVNVPGNGGFVLPQTGGAGTAIFAGVGGIVLISAIVLMVRARRRQSAADHNA